MNSQRGDELPVSEFVEYADGTMPVGTAAFEKRGVGIRSPRWNPEGCVQCNACSLVCPHACIRPLVIREEDTPRRGHLHNSEGCLTGFLRLPYLRLIVPGVEIVRTSAREIGKTMYWK